MSLLKVIVTYWHIDTNLPSYINYWSVVFFSVFAKTDKNTYTDKHRPIQYLLRYHMAIFIPSYRNKVVSYTADCGANGLWRRIITIIQHFICNTGPQVAGLRWQFNIEVWPTSKDCVVRDIGPSASRSALWSRDPLCHSPNSVPARLCLIGVDATEAMVR